MAITKAENTINNSRLVSVLLITYNHEKFISQALDSIISQQGNVLKEIIIAEDYSTDNTRKIIDTYYVKYPNLIKKIYRQNNIGLNKNFVEGLMACSGEFIATLSGDDYWTDEYKLLNQYNFLSLNREYSLVAYNAMELWHEKNEFNLVHADKKPFDMSFFDFFKFNSVIATMAFFINKKKWQFPDIYFLGDGEDRQLWMMLTSNGKARIQNNIIGGVYRRHKGSITLSSKSTRMDDLKNRIANNFLWAEYFKCDNNEGFLLAQREYKKKLFIEIVKTKNIKEFLFFVFKYRSNLKSIIRN